MLFCSGLKRMFLRSYVFWHTEGLFLPVALSHLILFFYGPWCSIRRESSLRSFIMKQDDSSFCCGHVNNSSGNLNALNLKDVRFSYPGDLRARMARNNFLVEEAVLIMRPEIKWPGHLWGSCFHSNPMGGVERAKAAKSNCFSLYLFIYTL